MNAYPIPDDNDSVNGVVCFKVVVPNSTGWIQTFHRALDSMALGRSWVRDTGIIVEAQAIGLMIAESAQQVNCGECEPCDHSEIETALSEIMGILEEINQMNVTIHNNVGCGCGVQETTTTTTTTGAFPDGWGDIDWDGDYPMSTNLPPTDPNYLEYKCNASNHAIKALRDVSVQIVGVVQTGEEATEQVQDILVSSLAWLDNSLGLEAWFSGLWQVFYLFSTQVINQFTAGMSIAVVNWIDDNYGSLVNSLYCANNHQQSYDNFVAMVNLSPLGLVSNQFVKLVMRMVRLQALYFEESDRVVIPMYSGTCECEAVPDPVSYDYDVTIVMGEGEQYMEYVNHTDRAGLSAGYAWINNNSVFLDKRMGVSHNGLRAILADLYGVGVVQSATLESFHFEATGASDQGGWVEPTCTQGYTHSIKLDDGSDIESGILVSCPDYNWYGASGFVEGITLDDDDASLIYVSQSIIDGVPTNQSQLYITKMRFAGNVTL